MAEQIPLFPEPDGHPPGNTSDELAKVLGSGAKKETTSEKEGEKEEGLKQFLLDIYNIFEAIEKAEPFERRKTDFATDVIGLWEKHEGVFSTICKEGCESIKQVVNKMGQLKEQIDFDLEINHFRLAGLIWHMRKSFHIEGNDNPLPINVINGVICPAFGCSKEEEKKIALGGAYQ